MRLIQCLKSLFGWKKKPKVNNEPVDIVNDLHPRLSNRIDEHRNLMAQIAKHTDLLVSRPWIKIWMLDMDDYLLKIFRATNGRSPGESDDIRPLPFEAKSIMLNPFSPPEWIRIEGVSDGSHEFSGAEWQNVNFAVPPNTALAVADFIISQLRPRDGVHVSEYDPHTGKGRFTNMGFDFIPGTYSLHVNLDAL